MIKNKSLKASALCSIVLSFAFFFAVSAAFPESASSASSFAHLDSGEGVTFDGQPVVAGQDFSTPGLVKTDASHPAQITMTASRSKLILRPATSLDLARPSASDEQTHTLREGMVRAIVAHQKAPYFKVKTTAAMMGVRGTDFLTISNPLLGESELIVFDGTVDLQSGLDPSDSKLVTKGHWGGVGGRFGKKIGDLIDLPSNVLSHFDEISK